MRRGRSRRRSKEEDEENKKKRKKTHRGIRANDRMRCITVENRARLRVKVYGIGRTVLPRTFCSVFFFFFFHLVSVGSSLHAYHETPRLIFVRDKECIDLYAF